MERFVTHQWICGPMKNNMWFEMLSTSRAVEAHSACVLQTAYLGEIKYGAVPCRKTGILKCDLNNEQWLATNVWFKDSHPDAGVRVGRFNLHSGSGEAEPRKCSKSYVVDFCRSSVSFELIMFVSYLATQLEFVRR